MRGSYSNIFWPALDNIESRERELLFIVRALRSTLILHAALYGYFGWKRIGSEEFFGDLAGFLLFAILVVGMRRRPTLCSGALAALSAIELLSFLLIAPPPSFMMAILEAAYLYFAIRGLRIGRVQPFPGTQHG